MEEIYEKEWNIMEEQYKDEADNPDEPHDSDTTWYFHSHKLCIVNEQGSCGCGRVPAVAGGVSEE